MVILDWHPVLVLRLEVAMGGMRPGTVAETHIAGTTAELSITGTVTELVLLPNWHYCRAAHEPKPRQTQLVLLLKLSMMLVLRDCSHTIVIQKGGIDDPARGFIVSSSHSCTCGTHNVSILMCPTMDRNEPKIAHVWGSCPQCVNPQGAFGGWIEEMAI